VLSFKSVVFKIGLVMTVFFLSRLVCSVVLPLFLGGLNVGVTAVYIISLPIQYLFLYIIPIGVAATLLKTGKIGGFYKKPPRMAKALGNFPAIVGLGHGTNFLFMLIIFIISKFTPDNIHLEKAFSPMESLAPPNFVCGVVLAFGTIVCAPLFEEFLTRGIFLGSLKPYGEGFAIIVSGVLFGLMHGNLQQFLYATVLGIALGYIAAQTDSILPTTILHALFNSLSAVMLIFASTESVQKLLTEEYANGVPDSDMLVLALYGMFFALFIGLIFAGIALAVRKITRLKAYRVSNEFAEIKAGKKAAVILTSVPIIITLIFAADAFAGSVIAERILNILKGAGT